MAATEFEPLSKVLRLLMLKMKNRVIYPQWRCTRFLLIAFIIVTSIISIIFTYGCESSRELVIYFIDTGGDSIFIDLGQTEILIDGGIRDSNNTVAEYLTNYVDGPLEIMVVTHWHHDHVGGLIAVLDNYSVEEIWLTESNTALDTLLGFSERVDHQGSTVNEVRRGDSFRFDELFFEVLNPSQSVYANINDNSIVLRMAYGEITALFTGDIERDAEADILKSEQLVQADILKVAHHGCATSSTATFLEAVKPKLAICQSRGQAHPDVIERLTDIGAEVYIQEFRGNIVIYTDGETYNVEIRK